MLLVSKDTASSGGSSSGDESTGPGLSRECIADYAGHMQQETAARYTDMLEPLTDSSKAEGCVS
jgi:hypothetical protein